MKSFPLLLLALLTLFTLGCTHSALSEESHAPDPAKSIVLLTLHLENRVKPENQAWGYQLTVTNTQTSQPTTFRFHPPEIQQDNQYVQHLIALPLDPGPYKLTDLAGGRDLVVTSYFFQTQPNVTFQASPQTTAYIGRLQLINRSPRPNESTSNARFPLVGQSLSGYSGGVIDIIVTDHNNKDIPAFRSTYPFLQSRTITTNLMTK